MQDSIPMRCEILLRATANTLAEQCVQMGLAVGDVIQGRDRMGSEDRLTLLWLGQTLAVFGVQRRSAGVLVWSAPCESSAWTLHGREWNRVASD
jgi:hypothetical protein